MYSPHVSRRPVCTTILAAGLLVAAAVSARGAAPAATRGRDGMVVSPSAFATQIGVDVLEDGGNAVDAAVATAFALAVTWPVGGNLGGGGFLLYRSAEGGHEALDFRETAPSGIDPSAYLDEGGSPIAGRSLDGGLAVAVPGSVAGLHAAHERWGSLPWRRLVVPAIRLARDGFPVSAELAGRLEKAAPRLASDPGAAEVFLPGGRPPRPGDTLVQLDLADTLRLVARRGPAGFYDGPVAESVERTVRREGGVLDRADLTSYRVEMREPLVGTYRGHRVVTFPPPSSGGIVLLQILGMLESFDVAGAGFGSSTTIHMMAEAERRAYADRSLWMGDPDFFEVPVDELLDRAYVAARAATIRPDRASSSASVLPGRPLAVESTETLHLSVTDRRGSAVALTTTLNAAFGAALVAEGTGVLLNNEMDDFALAPGVPNKWGLVGNEANAVEPGKRPLSSMSPTIVEPPHGDDRPTLVLGSPGGATIITSVLQVLVNVIDHGMPIQEAVNAPRVHHQWLPDVLRHEPHSLPADVAEALRGRGHQLEETDMLGNVNAIAVSDDGVWLGAADPRRGGSAQGH